jgi:hypothetical protein
MAYKSRHVTVGTSAVRLYLATTSIPQTGTPALNLTTRIVAGGGGLDSKPIVVQNQSATVNLFIGGTTVTTGNGFIIAPGQSLAFSIVGNESLYGIAASTITACVLVGRQ